MSAPAPSAGGAKRKWDGPSTPASSSSHKHADKKLKGSSSEKKAWVKKDAWANKNKGEKKPLVLTKKDRELKKKERKAAKPNADIIAEANKVWQTSFTQISAGERSQHITSLLAHMSGKMHEVGLKHDASRAIQLAVKYASEAQKHTIINELTGHFKQLSEEHYGHYIIIKLLSNDTKKGDAKKICLKEFKGHCSKLSMQPDSAKVLDYLFASSKLKDQNSILQEFYSPEFIVFAEEETTKDKNLTDILLLKPEKKNQILDNIRKYLDKALEKNMLMFRFLHALLLQYLTHANLADDAASKEFLPNLYQYIPALHHSVDGCRIICHMLSVGTSAKDRKGILKYFKGIVTNMAERAEGVWVITCALDVVDDTVLLEKVIFAELLPTLKEQLTHQYSSRIYLHVLNSHDAGIFSKDEQENYSVSGKWILNATEAAQRAGTMLSKKDPATKRLELLGTFLLPTLQALATLPDTLAALMRSNAGHHLLLETIKEAWRLEHDAEALAAASAAPVAAAPKKKGKGGAAAAAVKAEEETKMDEDEEVAAPAAGSRFPASLAKKVPQLPAQLGFIFDSLCAECAVPLDTASKGDAMGAKSNPLEDRFGHYVLKRLLALQPTPDAFVTKLLDSVTEQLPVLATTNRPAFVLSNILEKDLPSHAARLRKELKPLLKQIIAASGSKPVAPVLKEEEADAAAPVKFAKKNAPVYNAYSTTNAGVELLAKLMQGISTDKPYAKGASAAAAAVVPATPAKAAGKAPKAAKKAAAVVDEDVQMKDEEVAAPVAQTPAKKAAAPKQAATAKKSAKKTSAAMEE